METIIWKLSMPGVVTLSIEVELGWGMHDLNEFDHISNNRTAEEIALERLLASCVKNDLSISFDIVGHLLEETCEGTHSGPYPDSWWKNDPGTSPQDHPQFYAPDLVNRIKNDPVDHEICTHTYSHILTEEMGKELLRTELSRVQELHKHWGIPIPESIVLPRHQNVDYSLLSEFGIQTVRRPVTDYGVDTNPFRKLLWLINRDHPPCESINTGNIIETTCTPHPSLTAQMLPNGQRKSAYFYRFLPQQMRERMHRQYLIDAIDLAAEKEVHIHLWTHLYNISNDSQWRAIEPALDYLGELQDQKNINVCRMLDLPERVS